MAITASMVKELREATGAGMMDAKKALVETDGDFDAAVDWLRTKGLSKAAKKSGRIAAEGLVAVSVDGSRGVAVEVNSETDFVAKDENFINFSDSIASLILSESIKDIEQLSNSMLSDNQKVEEARTELVTKVGEKISLRRFDNISNSENLGCYSHGSRIGTIVNLSGGDKELAKDIAMHIAASNPICIDESGIPSDLIEREKNIYNEQAQSSGKPPEIIEKMIEGKISKFLSEVSLTDQDFVKDPNTKISQLLNEKNATILSFTRFEVGEGIEVEKVDFATEVMSQIEG